MKRRSILAMISAGGFGITYAEGDLSKKSRVNEKTLEDHFERLLIQAKKDLGAIKKLTDDDLINARRGLRISEDDMNVEHVFLLRPAGEDFLELCWWNSFQSSVTRMAVILALNVINRDDDGAPNLELGTELFNDSQKKLRTLEFKLIRANKKKWEQLSKEILEVADKLWKEYAE